MVLTQLPNPSEAEMTLWRRELHQCPELGFDVPQTAQYITEKLQSFGIETHTAIGRTGIVGVLRKGKSHPHYDFNDKILTTGVGYWINLVQQQLPVQI